MAGRAREFVLVAALFGVGVVAFHLWGAKPDVPRAEGNQGEPWVLARPPAGDLEAVDQVWITRGPWGLPPEPEPVSEPPAPPPSYPVGIVVTSSGPAVMFVVPGGDDALVRVGQEIPGGGRVTKVFRMQVQWIDRDGKKQQRELLGDPAVLPASSI